MKELFVCLRGKSGDWVHTGVEGDSFAKTKECINTPYNGNNVVILKFNVHFRV